MHLPLPCRESVPRRAPARRRACDCGSGASGQASLGGAAEPTFFPVAQTACRLWRRKPKPYTRAGFPPIHGHQTSHPERPQAGPSRCQKGRRPGRSEARSMVVAAAPPSLDAARAARTLARPPSLGNPRPAPRRLAQDQRPRRLGHRGDGPHDHGKGLVALAGRHAAVRPEPAHGGVAGAELLPHARAPVPLQALLLLHVGRGDRCGVPAARGGARRGPNVSFRAHRGRPDRDPHRLPDVPDRRQGGGAERRSPGRSLPSRKHAPHLHVTARERPQSPGASLRPGRRTPAAAAGREILGAGLGPRRSDDRTRGRVQVRAAHTRASGGAGAAPARAEPGRTGTTPQAIPEPGRRLARASPPLGRPARNAGGALFGLALSLHRLETDRDRHRRAAARSLLRLGRADGLPHLASNLPRGLASARHGLARLSPGDRRTRPPLAPGPGHANARLDPAYDRARQWNAEVATRTLRPGRAALSPDSRRVRPRARRRVGADAGSPRSPGRFRTWLSCGTR